MLAGARVRLQEIETEQNHHRVGSRDRKQGDADLFRRALVGRRIG